MTLLEGKIAPLPARAWIWAVAVVLVVFLFTPKFHDSQCLLTIRLFHLIQLPHNCDAVSIVNRLNDVYEFFVPFHNWKERPAYYLYGLVAGNILMPIAKPAWVLLQPFVQANAESARYGQNIHFHLAYILLQIGLTYVCVWCSQALTGVRFGAKVLNPWGAVAVAVAVASCDLVDGSVYMLHTNIFNLVGGIGAAVYFTLGAQARIHSLRNLASFGLLLGLGILSYEALAIMLPAYWLGLGYGLLRYGCDRNAVVRSLQGSLVVALLAFAPLEAWILLCRFLFQTGVFYTAQTGQFVWVIDALADGRLAAEFSMKLAAFCHVLADDMGLALAVALLAGTAFLILGRQVAGKWKDAGVLALAVALLGVLSFNFLQGYYAPRMHMAAVPLLHLLVARLAYLGNRPRLGTAYLLAVTAMQLGYELFHVTISNT